MPRQGYAAAPTLNAPGESSPSVSSVSASGCIIQAKAAQITRFTSLVHMAVSTHPMGYCDRAGKPSAKSLCEGSGRRVHATLGSFRSERLY